MYIKNIILDNNKKLETLIYIFKESILLLKNSNNTTILNISDIINEKDQYIISLINKINKKVEILNINKLETINDLYVFIDIYTYIYINIIYINEEFIYLYKLLNIDFTDYNLDFTTLNKIIKIKNNIINEYEFYINNNTIIIDLINYFNEYTYKFKNDENMYNYISNVFLNNNNIIELYIVIFNNNNNINIRKIHESNKDKILNIIYKKNKNESKKVINNLLQNFELISKDNCMLLHDLIYKITKIKSQKLQKANTISTITNELTNIIQNYSNISKKKISIIIYHIKNNINYNINGLKKNSKYINKYQGINIDLLNIFQTINFTDTNNKEKNNIMYTINYDVNDNNNSIILETSDMKNYKLLYYNNDYLISNNIVNNILRNQPSDRIYYYNKYIEDNIIKYINYTSIQEYYTKIYLDFNIDEQDIEILYKKLVNIIYINIMNNIKISNISDKQLFNIITNNEKIINIFKQKVNNFYKTVINKLKINNKDSSEIYLVYISYLNMIIYKFTKKLTDTYIYINENNTLSNEKKLEMIISESINSIINGRSNLFNIIVEKYHILTNYKSIIN